MALFTDWVWDVARDNAEARRRASLLYRLICEGSDSLVYQICCRLEVDRGRKSGCEQGEPLAWPNIVGRARQEGLLDEGEAQTLLGLAVRLPLEKSA